MDRTAHFLTLMDHGEEHLREILVRAGQLKAMLAAGEPHPTLAGRTLAMVFEKASTRTRVSFEAGMAQLGGHALYLTPSGSQMGRGEPLADTARVLAGYVDAVLIRTFEQATVEGFAAHSAVPVINGLTDLTHPCQVLSDVFTVEEVLGPIEDLKVAWVGDGNNMANSWLAAAGVFGFELTLACPEGYSPDPRFVAFAEDWDPDRVRLVREPARAVAGAQVINTDVWASMGQEEEAEARRKAFAGYCLTPELLAAADPDYVVLHCLPAHRGEEIAAEVLEGEHSVAFRQAANRLHVQKALLESLIA